MGTGQKRNNYVVQAAAKALHNLKYEVSKELNIDTSPIVGDYWGYMTTRDCGAVGGHMVKQMILAAEQSLSQQAVANVKAGFNAGIQSTSTQQNDKVQPNASINLNSIDNIY